MSFVICVCGEKFSTIMSDGRMIRLPNNDIVAEDACKIVHVNKDIAFAFTGDPIPIKIAFEEIRKCKEFEEKTYEEIKLMFIEKIRINSINSLGVRLIFTGKDAFKKFFIQTVNIDNNGVYESQPIYPKNSQVANAYSGNDINLCKKIVEKNLSNKTWLNFDDLEKSMISCIKDVAERDITVNTNIYKVVII